MDTTLDIGGERKASLEAEARAQGVSPEDLARRIIDEGVDRARRERARAEWIEAARPGFEWEAEYVERHGLLLSEYRPRFETGGER